MATLKDFFNPAYNGISLKEYIQKYGLKNFVETGTGIGETVGFVLNDFDRIFSMEIIPELVRTAMNKYGGYNHVCII